MAEVGRERGPTLVSSMKVSFADMAWLQKPKRRRKKQRKSEQNPKKRTDHIVLLRDGSAPPLSTAPRPVTGHYRIHACVCVFKNMEDLAKSPEHIN